MRLAGIMLIVAVGSTVAGCALRDPRDGYAYGSGSDGLWKTNFELIDWNFPTSRNQDPIEAPKRIRLEPTAIGVTWATRNPIPLNDPPPSKDAPSANANDAAQAGNAVPAPPRVDGARTAAGERAAPR